MTLLNRDMLDAVRFTPQQLDTLFQAILVDDDVDEHTELPDRITLDHDVDLFADCFRIARQLWMDGVDLAELRSLVALVRRDRVLDAEDRLRFKYMRAKLKHFRFAFALFDSRHRYPPLTDWMTTALGHLQDAFKNGQRGRVLHKAMVTDLFLSPIGWSLASRERDQLTCTSAAVFRRYVEKQMGELAAMVARPMVTGHQFHAGRKVASRQVAFYDAARTIRPSIEYHRMSRSLAAINGLMGDMHDDLIERRLAGLQDYHREPFALPGEIRDRIAALIERYRASGLKI